MPSVFAFMSISIRAHVRMADDRHILLAGGDVPALGPLHIAKGPCLLPGALGGGQPGDANIEPRVVHHREHAGHAVILFADQIADRAVVFAIGHDAGRAAVDAQLVLERDRPQIVARAERAVVVDQHLGYEEQGNALHARRTAFDPGEDEVDDIFRIVLVAEGDEDLLAVDAEPVAVAHRLRPQCADIGAGMGLGQVHGAGPFAGHQLGQVSRLLFRGAVGADRLDGADRQHRAQRPARVRRAPHLGDRGIHGPGQALAADLRIERHAVPAAFDEFPVGVPESGRRAHHAVLEDRALLVAAPVQRSDHLAGQPAGLVQDGADQIAGRFFVAGQRGDSGRPAT